MSGPLGAGLAPAGSTPAGYGSPGVVKPAANKLLTGYQSNTYGGRYIDPITNDYVFLSDGTAKGISEAQQLVYLALKTIRGSSAVPGLGQTFGTITVVGSNFKNQIRSAVSLALADLTSRNLINLIDVLVDRTPEGAVKITVQWRDMSNGNLQFTPI